jgi:hypothetical protein
VDGRVRPILELVARRAYAGLVRSLIRARPLVAELALTPWGR